MHGETVKKKM